ncbi:hypothetical protein [Cryobacterium roopkundense]|uniref:Carboxypeptidase regulatory-like domain-containing protein n=1 Tax=Cryobacterium roopkundense TaxID=1001240 RepID=A0A7W9E4B0_9MICO|nr:hypothetical protein [Cryobacterium roopkundense]MBB5641931.1 hypothetical protein [Cryobacterium roopkundense]
MSVVRSSLSALVSVLAEAVAPDSVGVSDGGGPGSTDAVPTDPVIVRVLTLERIGRSRRDGPVLDLELSAAVSCTGPRSLENAEQMLTAVENTSRYSVAPLTPEASSAAGLGFLVRVPVTLRLTEPSGPAILEPVHVTTMVGRRLSGVVVGPDGRGIAGVSIRSRASSVSVASDTTGRFTLLSSLEAVQQFTVEFRGVTRLVTAPVDPALVLTWAPT